MANRCLIALSFPLEAIPEPKLREELYKQYKEDRARTLVDDLGAHGNTEENDNEIWVTPPSYMHITRARHAGEVYSPLSIALDPCWEFRWSFPAWAQIGFAGAKKTCGGIDHGARGYLLWELPVKEVISNLKYAIKVLKNFPISTKLASWKWVTDDLLSRSPNNEHLVFNNLRSGVRRRKPPDSCLKLSECGWCCSNGSAGQWLHGAVVYPGSGLSYQSPA